MYQRKKALILVECRGDAFIVIRITHIIGILRGSG